MNLTISPQIRVLALVGLLAVVALGGSTLVLGRSHGSTATQVPVRRHAPAVAKTPSARAPAAQRAKHASPAKRTHGIAAKTSPKNATKNATATKHAAAAKSVKPAAPAHRGNPVYSDLPQPLQWQLSQHKVVVVSVYDPQAEADMISVAEAHAGAVDAGAGFLLVSVLDNKVAGVLTALLPGGGLLPDPGVLVYRAPGNIALRINGFVDRASVVQAASNVLAGETVPAASAATP
jgi:hypothetical protein